MRIKTREIHGWSALALGLILLIYPYAAVGGTAGEQLKESIEKIRAILEDRALKGEATAQERRKKLREIVYARFDFNDMAKRSLGAQWQKRSPEEQKEFVQLFTDLLTGYSVVVSFPRSMNNPD